MANICEIYKQDYCIPTACNNMHCDRREEFDNTSKKCEEEKCWAVSPLTATSRCKDVVCGRSRLIRKIIENVDPLPTVEADSKDIVLIPGEEAIIAA